MKCLILLSVTEQLLNVKTAVSDQSKYGLLHCAVDSVTIFLETKITVKIPFAIKISVTRIVLETNIFSFKSDSVVDPIILCKVLISNLLNSV